MFKIPQISIIVPIYNMEALLERALNSILSQSFLEWECLLIDDGSNDKSPKICDEYVKKDSRFRVFHKKNEGVSSARQFGLENALGVYTIHVDPDDWIDFDMLTSLYQVAEKKHADMVICDFMIENKRGSFYKAQKPECLEPTSVMNQLFMMKLHGSCCNKLIKRSCYLKNEISFPKDMIMWEDLFVCCRILQENIRVAYISKPFYHYDCASNDFSIVSSSSRKKIESKKLFINFFEAEFDDSVDLYFLKKDLKLGMMRLLEVKPEEIEEDEVINTYAEINQRLLDDLIFSFRSPLYNALKLVILGKNVKFIMFYLKSHRILLSLLAFLKHIFFRKII